ncbi:hypothetical protein DFH09DRAFT_1464635 [Mycena vulgaris]|nr:hypothetical protein DFH09DRAFT_1464635 [Mycena vulgaris]
MYSSKWNTNLGCKTVTAYAMPPPAPRPPFPPFAPLPGAPRPVRLQENSLQLSPIRLAPTSRLRDTPVAPTMAPTSRLRRLHSLRRAPQLVLVQDCPLQVLPLRMVRHLPQHDASSSHRTAFAARTPAPAVCGLPGRSTASSTAGGPSRESPLASAPMALHIPPKGTLDSVMSEPRPPASLEMAVVLCHKATHPFRRIALLLHPAPLGRPCALGVRVPQRWILSHHATLPLPCSVATREHRAFYAAAMASTIFGTLAHCTALCALFTIQYPRHTYSAHRRHLLVPALPAVSV